MKQVLVKPDHTGNREDALWEAFAKGDLQARQELVEQYTPLVVNVIRRLLRRLPARLSVRELLGAGTLGLLQAIDGFDGVDYMRFPGYARQRIRGAVLDEMRHQDPLTRDQRRHYHRICAAIASLSRLHHQQPTMEQIATEVDLPVDKVDMYLQMGRPAISLDEDLEEGFTMHDLLPSQAPGPAEEADRSFCREALRDAFRTLSQREQQVMVLRLYENLRVSEVAAAMNLTEGRISQIYWECVAKLRIVLLANQ